MTDAVVEVISGLILMILSGLGFYTRRAHTRIDDMQKAVDKSVEDLDRRKANIEDVQEMKSDIKEILRELKQLEVSTARWQGRAENQGSNKPERS